jgi:hypothetical protein
MQYLLLTFIALAFVVFAPAKVTLLALLVIGVTSFVVKLIASKLIGEVSIADAFKAVGWSVGMLAVAVAGLLFVSGGQLKLEGLVAVAAFAGLFAAFVLGFKLALDATFGASAAIAAVSTVVSASLL